LKGRKHSTVKQVPTARPSVSWARGVLAPPMAGLPWSPECVAQDMPQLTVVVLDDVQLETLPLGACPSLRALHIQQCKRLRELPLGGITALARLQVEGCQALRQVTGLPGLHQLRQLSLMDCSRLAELVPSRRGSGKNHNALQTLGKLEVLAVKDCPKLERGTRKELESLVRHSTRIQKAVVNGKHLIKGEETPERGVGGNSRPSLSCKVRCRQAHARSSNEYGVCGRVQFASRLDTAFSCVACALMQLPGH
jgi:hypothetical protein